MGERNEFGIPSGELLIQASKIVNEHSTLSQARTIVMDFEHSHRAETTQIIDGYEHLQSLIASSGSIRGSSNSGEVSITRWPVGYFEVTVFDPNKNVTRFTVKQAHYEQRGLSEPSVTALTYVSGGTVPSQVTEPEHELLEVLNSFHRES